MRGPNQELIFIAAILAGSLTFEHTAAAQAPRTVLDGVYTEAQAARGQAAYNMNCLRCHAATLEGQPNAPLKGSAFLDRWREDSLNTIFSDIKTRMPNDDPGSLGESTYLDIVTWILKSNTFPAGSKELTASLLGSTELVGKEGPKPLPSNTLVRAVGCLTPGPNKKWILASAGEPTRTADGEDSTPDELKSSAAAPLGNQSFFLVPSTALSPAFSFEAVKGHKVQAKGVLVREPGNDHISVASIETLTPDCGK